MRDTDHYARLLGIQPPWSVSLVELDEPELTVTIYARIDSTIRLGCPRCQRKVPRYDVRRRRWRHLDTMQFRTFIDAEVPRIECPEHGVLQVRVPWAEDSSRYTAAFEARVIDWLKDASTAAVARRMKLGWNAIDS